MGSAKSCIGLEYLVKLKMKCKLRRFHPRNPLYDMTCEDIITMTNHEIRNELTQVFESAPKYQICNTEYPKRMLNIPFMTMCLLSVLL